MIWCVYPKGGGVSGYFGEVKIDKNVGMTWESVTRAKPAVFKHRALKVDGTADITSDVGIKLEVTKEITVSVNPAVCNIG